MLLHCCIWFTIHGSYVFALYHNYCEEIEICFSFFLDEVVNVQTFVLFLGRQQYFQNPSYWSIADIIFAFGHIDFFLK